METKPAMTVGDVHDVQFMYAFQPRCCIWFFPTFLSLLVHCICKTVRENCKTVRLMLSDRCLSCLSVYNVGVLWPNGWISIALGMEWR